ncbi:MAG: 2-nitropropane dioxygenase [Bdellovibrionales bacterium GWA2_49_15]|nr:MAG: 2-nitropropane dioxygenase [Bdellovibrionales bacterium GWA2_49_15]
MVWVSGGKLAAAVSNAGGLGIIGAGSMKPDLLAHHLDKAQGLTNRPLAVNIPLLYSQVEEQIKVALDKGIKIFFTSAGTPKKYTPFLKEKGCVVVHVTSTPELAAKSEAAGVDAVVAEGFEAGGHNGRAELATLPLIPQVVDMVKIPVIAAGGIGDGRGIAAAFALGASGVQMGTRFLATQESSAHPKFKELVIHSRPEDTRLLLKKLVPVRLLKNAFYQQAMQLEEQGADVETLQKLLGKGRAKLGMLEGDLEEGELEVGQISGLVRDLPTVEVLMQRLVKEYDQATRSFE